MMVCSIGGFRYQVGGPGDCFCQRSKRSGPAQLVGLEQRAAEVCLGVQLGFLTRIAIISTNLDITSHNYH